MPLQSDDNHCPKTVTDKTWSNKSLRELVNIVPATSFNTIEDDTNGDGGGSSTPGASEGSTTPGSSEGDTTPGGSSSGTEEGGDSGT